MGRSGNLEHAWAVLRDCRGGNRKVVQPRCAMSGGSSPVSSAMDSRSGEGARGRVGDEVPFGSWGCAGNDAILRREGAAGEERRPERTVLGQRSAC